MGEARARASAEARLDRAGADAALPPAFVMAARLRYDFRPDDTIRVLKASARLRKFPDGARVGDLVLRGVRHLVSRGVIEVVRDDDVVRPSPYERRPPEPRAPKPPPPPRPPGPRKPLDPWARVARVRAPGSIYDRPAPKDQKQRKCIRCGTMFLSEHAGHRFCVDCNDFARHATGFDE